MSGNLNNMEANPPIHPYYPQLASLHQGGDLQLRWKSRSLCSQPRGVEWGGIWEGSSKGRRDTHTHTHTHTHVHTHHSC